MVPSLDATPPIGAGTEAPTSTTPADPRSSPHDADTAVELYWLPLGAGGVVVRFCGRMYERLRALIERRRPRDLYHCALEVVVPEGHFTIELTPVQDAGGASRGVSREGPVGSRWLGRFRLFRYELRCWRDGVIPDAVWAVAGPERLTQDPQDAHRLLSLVASVPTPVWGRDELRTGEMWNSNSVIAWLIARSEISGAEPRPPAGGRAPGWHAGVVVARRQQHGRWVAPRSTAVGRPVPAPSWQAPVTPGMAPRAGMARQERAS